MFARMHGLAKLVVAVAVLTACQGKGGSDQQEVSQSSLMSANAVNNKVRNQGVTLSGPQYVMVSMSGHYILNVPSGVNIASANWTFSDGGLEVFDDVTAKGGFHLGDQGRVLYPTFMYTSNECKNEKKNHSNGHGGWDVEREHGSGNHDHCNKRDGRVHEEKRNCESTKVWIAPTTSTASCTVPAGIYVAAVCISSCATPEQNILVQTQAEKRLKYVTFAEAWEQNFPLVATLRAGSTASSKDVQGSKVEQWVTEMMDTEHVILEFHMQSGGVLRLTPNHPLLGADAMMHLAGEFKAGDSVVQLGFKLDKIVEVKTTSYFGKVYNVFVQSNDPRQNVVVINGYLNGSAFFQNEGAQNVNRDVLRIRLIQGVLSK